MNFVKRGTGKKTLVFLHGWGGRWQTWEPIIQKFKIQNSKFKIYAVDLPGFGLSELKKPYSLANYVSDLAEFFKINKIVKPILIGHSFGGQVAAKFAIEKGELLSKLILVDAAGVRRNDKQIRLDIALARWGKRMITATPLAFLYPVIRPIYYKIRGYKDSDYFNLKIGSNLQRTLATIMREDLMNEFSKIKIPTLIFWGGKDPPEFTPLSMGKTLNEQIKGSKLVIAPEAGHFSFLDEQELFCESLREFI